VVTCLVIGRETVDVIMINSDPPKPFGTCFWKADENLYVWLLPCGHFCKGTVKVCLCPIKKREE